MKFTARFKNGASQSHTLERKPRDRIKRQGAELPETAEIGRGEERLMIRDHRPDRNLFGWLLDAVSKHDPKIFAEMEEKGIYWQAVSEWLITDIKIDITSRPSFWNPDPLDARMIQFATGSTGKKLQADMVRTIQNCDSYKDFAEKFNEDSEFVKETMGIMAKEINSWDV